MIIKTYTEESSQNLIDSLAQSLIETALASQLERIYTAKVPIIKMIDRATNIHVDISFNINDGLEGVDIVKRYIKKYPQTKYITIVVKYFLKQRGLNDTYMGGIGSFLLFCMVVSSVQMHSSYRSDHRNLARYSLGHYLMNFFKIYGEEFNYGTIGISIKDEGEYFIKRDQN